MLGRLPDIAIMKPHFSSLSTPSFVFQFIPVIFVSNIGCLNQLIILVSSDFKHEPTLTFASTWNLFSVLEMIFCHYLWGNLLHSNCFYCFYWFLQEKKVAFLQILNNLCGCHLSHLMICFQSLYPLRLKFFSGTPFLYCISHIFLPSDVFFICCFNCLRFRLKIWQRLRVGYNWLHLSASLYSAGSQF